MLQTGMRVSVSHNKNKVNKVFQICIMDNVKEIVTAVREAAEKFLCVQFLMGEVLRG